MLPFPSWVERIKLDINDWRVTVLIGAEQDSINTRKLIYIHNNVIIHIHILMMCEYL